MDTTVWGRGIVNLQSLKKEKTSFRQFFFTRNALLIGKRNLLVLFRV